MSRLALHRAILLLAAGYNVAFGLWAAFAPRAFFELFGLDAPRYPAIWATLGMVIGLYGALYAYAAFWIVWDAPGLIRRVLRAGRPAFLKSGAWCGHAAAGS